LVERARNLNFHTGKDTSEQYEESFEGLNIINAGAYVLPSAIAP